MTLLVPFDGSALSKAALARASEFAEFMDAPVVALVVVPDDPEYARERGWLEPGDPFDCDLIESRLANVVAEIAPDSRFRCERLDESEIDPLATTTTAVIRRIREVAGAVDAQILFVGSENAGQVSSPLSSVGNPLSEDPRYDVHIVRHPDDADA
jgi:nucleotide-binding universal stress UspA family protein